MLFKNFDQFSSVLHFSTLKLLLFSCRKSLRFFSAHILKLCVFSQKCAWKTQNANQKLSLILSLWFSVNTLLYLNSLNLYKCKCAITQCCLTKYIWTNIYIYLQLQYQIQYVSLFNRCVGVPQYQQDKTMHGDRQHRYAFELRKLVWKSVWRS